MNGDPSKDLVPRCEFCRSIISHMRWILCVATFPKRLENIMKEEIDDIVEWVLSYQSVRQNLLFQ
jgi:hypothetical protein